MDIFHSLKLRNSDYLFNLTRYSSWLDKGQLLGILILNQLLKLNVTCLLMNFINDDFIVFQKNDVLFSPF
ncbi:hypothetical protein BGP_1924 [Beggiatoa sp. PS]|nr:hypothetical protein BGP_1924 [Beggiatoa sp. PS]